MNPKYLVTGGSGFIGSNLVAALVRRGERVRVFDNLLTGRFMLLDRLGLDGPSVDRVTGDIRDSEALASAMKGIEVVLHHAAIGSVPRSIENPIEADQVNIGGTVRVLEAARHAGVRRVVLAASSAAYGNAPGLPKRESMPTAPMSPYAVSKITGEQYLRVFAELYGLETISLRYFNIFGPNQLPDGPYAAAIPRFIRAVLSGRPISVFGDGEQTRDFCFIDNVVHANLLSANSARPLRGEIVNIAGGRTTTLNGLIRELETAFGRKLAVDYLAPRAGDVLHSSADISLAASVIGYEPVVAWEKGLVPTIEFLRELQTKG